MERDSKAQAQARFGQLAQAYVASLSHASGDDLERLLTFAQPQPDWRLLDIATGGGHTALHFAPHVRQVIAADLTPRMLMAARQFIQRQSGENVAYVATDAENLAFPANRFDAITCRIAPHHFPDCFRFVQECTRVLKPGGILLIEDNTVPDDERAARYVDSFERLRDPSHHRCYAGYEWEGLFLDAGLEVEALEHIQKPGTALLDWAERQGCSPYVIEHLQVMLAQAPAAVCDWLRPIGAGTRDATFDHHYVIIKGRKRSD